MREFNENIKKIIEKFSYNFYVVQQDFRVMCTCVDFSTKQPSPLCPKCLGTGRKVRIKEIRGASEDRKGSFRNMGMDEQTLATVYYIDAKYPVFEQNLIVDEDEVYIIHRLEKKKTANKETVYYQAMAHFKKSHNKEFLKNFNRVVKGG